MLILARSNNQNGKYLKVAERLLVNQRILWHSQPRRTSIN